MEWNFKNRDRNQNLLMEWFTDFHQPTCRCGESGMDNTPRFDTDAVLEAIDFSCFMANEMRCMSAIAKVLSKPEAAAKYADLYQKMGYCRQQEGDIEDALKYYEQSELLNSQSLWTLRRIAGCYKLLGRPAKALEYFCRVAEKKEEDLAVALNIGHCLMELGRYDEALRYYFKVEFLDEKSTRAWRPIAWCSLLARDFEQSRRYYGKVADDNPTAGDLLNMGHLELASGNVRRAIDRYKESVIADGGNTESFIASMEADKHYLVDLGVDVSSVPLLIDAMLYELN